MIEFPRVIAVSESERDIKTGLLGWHTSTLTNQLQKVQLQHIFSHSCSRISYLAEGEYILDKSRNIPRLIFATMETEHLRAGKQVQSS